MVLTKTLALAILASLSTSMASPLEERAVQPFFNVLLYKDFACEKPQFAVPNIQINANESGCLEVDKKFPVNSFQFVNSGGVPIRKSSLQSYTAGCTKKTLIVSVPGNTVNEGTCYSNDQGKNFPNLRGFNSVPFTGPGN